MDLLKIISRYTEITARSVRDGIRGPTSYGTMFDGATIQTLKDSGSYETLPPCCRNSLEDDSGKPHIHPLK